MAFLKIPSCLSQEREEKRLKCCIELGIVFKNENYKLTKQCLEKKRLKY